jgi:predicted methyltransferase
LHNGKFAIDSSALKPTTAIDFVKRWLAWSIVASLLSMGCRQRVDVSSQPTQIPVAAVGSVGSQTLDATVAIDSKTPSVVDATVYPAGTYMGRSLAQTMSHEASSWLTRPERVREENPDALIEALGLTPGQTACDFGCGNGYHTLMMAKAVAPNGRAIGIDIQPQMLTQLRARAKAAKVDNVETVLSSQSDPKIPVATCDVILLADVYHELSDPSATLRQLKSALKPGGTIALVEFRGEDDNVPIKELHKMTKAQIVREYQANGLQLQRAVDDLPWQHLMFMVPVD